MQNPTKRVLIGLGSNLGNREDLIQHTFQAIQRNPDFEHVVFSSIYETDPVGGAGSDYLNAVASFDTNWEVSALHRWMMGVEQSAGRVRTVVNAPRTLDLDLLFYGSDKISNTDLKVPHPRLHERAFVLIPLCEIVPGFVHPVLNQTVEELLRTLPLADLKGVRKYSVGVSQA